VFQIVQAGYREMMTKRKGNRVSNFMPTKNRQMKTTQEGGGGGEKGNCGILQQTNKWKKNQQQGTRKRKGIRMTKGGKTMVKKGKKNEKSYQTNSYGMPQKPRQESRRQTRE